MKKQIDSFKLSSSKNIKLEILLFVLIIIAVMLIGLLINLKYNQFKEENKKLFATLNYCNKINIEIDNNNLIKMSLTKKDIQSNNSCVPSSSHNIDSQRLSKHSNISSTNESAAVPRRMILLKRWNVSLLSRRR